MFTWLKWRNRTCKCGRVDFTASQSPVCMTCYKQDLKDKAIIEERERVFGIYGNVEGPSLNQHQQRCYTFVHTCGTEQTWRFGNLIKQLQDNPTFEPCSKCGAKCRAKAASDAYMKIYGRDYTNIDYADWDVYRLSVRRLSDITWRDNQAALNSDGVKRSMSGWHLDHIVPIIVCFREGITTERAASIENLRLMTAQDNMARSWYETDAALLEALRRK